MRQIDNMTPAELEVLQLKGMTPPSKSPFTPLHPTFKACKCGHIGTKTQFYRHLKLWRQKYDNDKDFFTQHGEVPLCEDDPRVQLSATLAATLELHDNSRL